MRVVLYVVPVYVSEHISLYQPPCPLRGSSRHQGLDADVPVAGVRWGILSTNDRQTQTQTRGILHYGHMMDRICWGEKKERDVLVFISYLISLFLIFIFYYSYFIYYILFERNGLGGLKCHTMIFGGQLIYKEKLLCLLNYCWYWFKRQW